MSQSSQDKRNQMKLRLYLIAVLLAPLCVAVAEVKTDSLRPASERFPELSPLPQTGSVVPPMDPNKFTFFVAGDSRPHTEKDPPTDAIVKFFNEVARHKPSLAVLTGDTVYGKNPREEKTIQGQYATFLKLAKSGGVPVFNAPGNHEMDDQDDVPSAQMQKWYSKYMAQLCGAFDYGNSRFIALNTEEVAPTGIERAPRASTSVAGKTLDPGYVSAAQLDALKADLDLNRGKTHIFVFMHHPIKPAQQKNGLDPQCARPLEALFRQHQNVSYVIAAHEHLYYNAQGKDGTAPPPAWKSNQPPIYIVSGGAGAPLSKSPAPGLAVYHYLVFAVDGDEVRVTFKTL